MKIGYIGRREILEELLKSKINKLELNYTSFRESYYILNEEVIKLFKIKNLDEVYIDYCCSENDAEANKILNSAQSVRYNLKIKLVISDRKLYTNDFNTLILNSTDTELKKEAIQKKEDQKAQQKAHQKKISIPKISMPNLSMPSISLPKIDVRKLLPEKKITEKEKTVPAKKIVPIQSQDLELELRSPVTILHSPFELQGTSFLSNKLLQRYSNLAIIDVDLSYVKYTSFENIDDYLENTFISSENGCRNDYHIYTLKKSPLEILKIIDTLSNNYQYVLVDINDEDIFQKIISPGSDIIYILSAELKNISAFRKYENFDSARLYISEQIYDFITIKDIKNLSGFDGEIIAG